MNGEWWDKLGPPGSLSFGEQHLASLAVRLTTGLLFHKAPFGWLLFAEWYVQADRILIYRAGKGGQAGRERLKCGWMGVEGVSVGSAVRTGAKGVRTQGDFAVHE